MLSWHYTSGLLLFFCFPLVPVEGISVRGTINVAKHSICLFAVSQFATSTEL